jgi:hypothetical protein
MPNQTNMPKAIEDLKTLLAALPERLAAIPQDKASHKPMPDQWSVKEELGHLIDSAINNHIRVIRTQLEDQPALDAYDQDGWVKLNNYQQREWNDLIKLWVSFNEQLLAASQTVPGTNWTKTCTVGSSEPLTLRYIISDYIIHMVDHFRHMGVNIDEIPISTSQPYVIAV